MATRQWSVIDSYDGSTVVEVEANTETSGATIMVAPRWIDSSQADQLANILSEVSLWLQNNGA